MFNFPLNLITHIHIHIYSLRINSHIHYTYTLYIYILPKKKTHLLSLLLASHTLTHSHAHTHTHTHLPKDVYITICYFFKNVEYLFILFSKAFLLDLLLSFFLVVKLLEYAKCFYFTIYFISNVNGAK